MSPSEKDLPPKFAEKLRTILPFSLAEKALRSFAHPKPVTFRVNTIKVTARDMRERLREQGFKLKNVPWYPDAFIMDSGRQRDLEDTASYQNGEIYLQNLSSMIPPLVLAPRSGEKVLDLTAAPGSKTTQMAVLMKNQGSITAADNNPIRVEKLKANLARQGATCAEAFLWEGSRVGKEKPETYDRVLLDAPCSAEGRFFVEDRSSFGYWREDTNRKMAKEQRSLFQSAFRALKPGGVMVYSTCTFSPEENEGILQWALEQFTSQMVMETIPFNLPNRMPGLSAFGDLKFHSSIQNAMRILPTPEMEGFFVARLKKTA